MDSNATQLIAAVVGSAAVTSVLGVLANGLVKFFNGTAGRERTRNTGLKEQRNEAWAEAAKSDTRADREAHNRRLTEEYASQLCRDCTELHYDADGRSIPQGDLRPWPELKKPPEAQGAS